MNRADHRSRLQRGTALVEFSWLAILLMLPLVYALISVFDVQREAYGSTAAARAATRAFLVAAPTGDEDQARDRAFTAASTAMSDQHASLSPDDFTLTCQPSCWTSGSTVSVEVRASVELPLLPHWFGDSQPAVHVTADDTEPYGEYRETR